MSAKTSCQEKRGWSGVKNDPFNRVAGTGKPTGKLGTGAGIHKNADSQEKRVKHSWGGQRRGQVPRVGERQIFFKEGRVIPRGKSRGKGGKGQHSGSPKNRANQKNTTKGLNII